MPRKMLVLAAALAMVVAFDHCRGEPAVAAEAPSLLAAGAVADTFDLSRMGWDRGSTGATVVVLEFSDFGCGYCARFSREIYPELHREFVATGKVMWKFVPFVMGNFRNSAGAARAAECAGEQGKFWEMQALLYERQAEWRSAGSAELFGEYAAGVGVDAERFGSCWRDDRPGARIRGNNRVASVLRLRATPSFIVEGRLVEGALPAEQFRQVLRATVAEAERRKRRPE